MNRTSKYHVRHMFYSYEGLKRKIVAMLFFRTVSLNNFFSLKFDPTLNSQNSTNSTNYSNKDHHIFRKPRTSAFRRHNTLDTSEKISNLRKKHLRLHSFGLLWTISTGNQWEISEVGRLNCFIDFLFDFTSFLINIHQIMLISLFPTPFDHFYFHQLWDSNEHTS